MKTYIYLFEGEYVRFQESVPQKGYAIGFNTVDEKFKHFWSLPSYDPFFRWRRGMAAKKLECPGLLKKLAKQNVDSFVEVRSSDFRKILHSLRRVQRAQEKTGIIDLTLREINSSFIQGHNASFIKTPYPPLLIKNINSEFLLEKNFNDDKENHLQLKKVVIEWRRQDKLNLNVLSLWKAVNFCHYFLIKPEGTEILFPNRLETTPFDWKRPIKDVLVISNLAGPTLNGLTNHPEKWSTAPQGIHVRHLFGSINRDRCERVIQEKSWDCVIYRGHSEIREGMVSYLLEDGSLYPVKKISTRLYIHLSCIPLTKENDITEMPASLCLLPFRLLKDQEDSNIAKDIFLAFKGPRAREDLIIALRKFNERFFYVCS